MLFLFVYFPLELKPLFWQRQNFVWDLIWPQSENQKIIKSLIKLKC